MGQWDEFVGRREAAEDSVWPPMLARMAATLGRADVPATLPPLWHWMLFQPWLLPGSLGADGHPRRGGFLPDAAALPRRMWAGSRVGLLGTLRAGEAVRRDSVITSVAERVGRSGKLLFATVRHEISGKNGVMIREFQDIVYRAGGAATRAGAAGSPPAGATRIVVPDPVLLFRYSALTGNGHRIHYDVSYATEVEHYPGLVVHGPLIATLLVGMVSAEVLAATRQIDIRARSAAYCGNALHLYDLATKLEALDPAGQCCMDITLAAAS
jgi:hydroxyacyl-ACP dehydratase HTD2-like protein with hotdog domain